MLLGGVHQRRIWGGKSFFVSLPLSHISTQHHATTCKTYPNLTHTHIYIYIIHYMYVCINNTGWWFGTSVFHILGIIIPTDSYVSEGLKHVKTTNQNTYHLYIEHNYGHLPVITGYKWDYTFYTWGYKYL